MNRFEILDNLVINGNGYLRTSQVLELGITKPTLAEYASKRNMLLHIPKLPDWSTRMILVAFLVSLISNESQYADCPI